MPPSVPTRIRTALSALRADASTAEPAPSEPTPSDEPAADPRLASVVAAARRIADGDLTVRLNPEGDDELAAIATALNAVTARFADTTSAMVAAAYSVSRSAGEVTAAVSEQTVSVDQQAAAITETSAAVEQLRTAAEHSAQRATQVAERASGAEAAAVNGTEAIRAITEAMAGSGLASTTSTARSPRLPGTRRRSRRSPTPSHGSPTSRICLRSTPR